MLGKALLVGAAAAALGVISAPAHADNIAPGIWYAFDFAATGSPLLGGGIPGTDPNGVTAPTAPWTITLSAPGDLYASVLTWIRRPVRLALRPHQQKWDSVSAYPAVRAACQQADQYRVSGVTDSRITLRHADDSCEKRRDRSQ